jgi:hypothetical protein
LSHTLPMHRQTKAWKLQIAARCLVTAALATVGATAWAQAKPAVKDFPFAKVGSWNVVLVAQDARGKGFAMCKAQKAFGTENWLVFMDDGKDIHVAFSGYSKADQSKPFAARWYVDKPSPDAIDTVQTRVLPDPETGFEFWGFTLVNEPGPVDALTAGQRLTIEGKGGNWTYSLAGSGDAFNKLQQCTERFAGAAMRR